LKRGDQALEKETSLGGEKKTATGGGKFAPKKKKILGGKKKADELCEILSWNNVGKFLENQGDNNRELEKGVGDRGGKKPEEGKTQVTDLPVKGEEM